MKKEKIESFFKLEYDLVNKCEHILQGEEISVMKLKEHTKQLLQSYKSLLKTTENITQTSYIAQEKNIEVNRKIKEKNLLLEHKNKQLHDMCMYDYLTQIYNRRYLISIIDKEFKNAIKENTQFVISILDIDKFKNINDTFGHLAGDYVLKKIATLIKGTIRSSDVIGRYGGEEFLIILPNTNISDGFKVIERVRKNIQNAVYRYEDLNINVTASFGLIDNITNYAESINEMIFYADCALYKAKEMGRNRAVVYNESNTDLQRKVI